jgi:hypothetical protein
MECLAGSRPVFPLASNFENTGPNSKSTQTGSVHPHTGAAISDARSGSLAEVVQQCHGIDHQF